MSKKPHAAAQRGLATDAFELARSLLCSPAKAAQRLNDDPEAVPAALALYLVFLAVSVAFYSWKPADFPGVSDAPLPFGNEPLPQSPVFWAKVQAWQPILTGIWILFLAWFSRYLKGGRLPLRLMSGVGLTVLPIVPIILYASNKASGWVLLLTWGVVFGAMTPLLRGHTRESARRLVGLGLSIVVVNLALVPFFSAAVLAGSARAYHLFELVMLFWILGLGSFLLARLEALPTARAFAAIFFSMLSQLLLVASLHLAGLVPKNILKALMAV